MSALPFQCTYKILKGIAIHGKTISELPNGIILTRQMVWVRDTNATDDSTIEKWVGIGKIVCASCKGNSTQKDLPGSMKSSLGLQLYAMLLSRNLGYNFRKPCKFASTKTK